MEYHFLNTCPICGVVDKCRCSHCHRVYTNHLCARCSEISSSSEETTTANVDIPNTPRGRAGDNDTSYLAHKPLPNDTINLYLPFLMKKLGFSYLTAELNKRLILTTTEISQMQIIKELKKRGHISLAKKIESIVSDGGWNTFFDPLTKQHIIKTGRLPGKEKNVLKRNNVPKRNKEDHEVSSDVFEDNSSTTIDPIQSIQPKQNSRRFVLRHGDYEIPNKILKNEEESSSSDDASLEHIKAKKEIVKQYKKHKKNFKI
jgi:hypothetical protein